MGSGRFGAIKLVWFLLCVAVLVLFAWSAFGLMGAGLFVIVTCLIGRYAVGLDRIAIGTGMFECEQDFVYKIDTWIPQCSTCGILQD